MKRFQLKTKLNLDYLLILWMCAILVLFVVGLSYAQTDNRPHIFAPEPANIALLSTGGFFGYLIRFARRRFHELYRYGSG